MTDPTAAELDAICARLTKAQRALLAEESHYFASGYKPGEKLVELKLLDRRRGNFGSVVRLTPLGVATRKRLIERMQK